MEPIRRDDVPAFDGLRVVAFLLVFIHHSPVKSVWGLEAISRIGWFGVELFFVISAYLFFHLFGREVERTGKIDARRFYQRRFLRIYPAMALYALAMTGLAFFMSPGPDLWMRLAAIFTFTGNILSAAWGHGNEPPFTAHLWTLSYEFQVYLAMPLIWWMFQRSGYGVFLRAALGLCVLALIARVAAVWLGADHPFIWVLPPLRPESVVAGLLLAISAPLALPIAARLVAGIGCLAALAVLPEIGTGWADVAIFPLVATGLYLVVGAVLDSNVLARLLSVGWLRYLGRISYGLYLYHLLAIGVAERLVVRIGLPVTASLPLALALTIALAALSYRFIEAPFLRLKSRLRGQKVLIEG